MDREDIEKEHEFRPHPSGLHFTVEVATGGCHDPKFQTPRAIVT
jgi:hypothetical protein